MSPTFLRRMQQRNVNALGKHRLTGAVCQLAVEFLRIVERFPKRPCFQRTFPQVFLHISILRHVYISISIRTCPRSRVKMKPKKNTSCLRGDHFAFSKDSPAFVFQSRHSNTCRFSSKTRSHSASTASTASDGSFPLVTDSRRMIEFLLQKPRSSTRAAAFVW